MATHDYVIANQSGAAFRTDLNNALAAIVSNNSNSTSPATTYAYQWWADTSAGILKIRNSANNAWVELLQLDGTLTLEDGSASTPGLAFRDDLNTGIFSSAADTFNVATAGVERMELGATTIFNEDGADVDFRIEGDTEANLFYLDAGNDRIGIGISSPRALFDLGTGTDASSASNTAADYQLGLHAAQSTGGDIGRNIGFIASSGGTVTAAINSVDEGGSDQTGLVFLTGNSSSIAERVRIDQSGNVGIGTTSPSEKLNVVGGIGATTDITLASTTSGQSFIVTKDGTQAAKLGHIGTGNEGILVLKDGGTDTIQLNGETGGNSYINSGNVAIGTTSPSSLLHTKATSADNVLTLETATSGSPLITFNAAGAGGHTIGFDRSTTALTFTVAGGSERARIDSSGRLLVGTSSSRSVAAGQALLQIENTTTELFSILNKANDSGGPVLAIGKTRNGAIVQDDDTLGRLAFYGDDGNDVDRAAADIMAAVDGTPGTDDMPGRLIFRTTADGGSNPTERLRIDSSGHVGIGTTTPDLLASTTDSTYLAVIETSGSRRGKLLLGDNQNADTGGIGDIHFVGHYQNSGHKEMATIKAVASGSTSGQRGATLIFETKTDGTAAIAERMRITSDGPHLLLGGTSDVNEITETSSNAGLVIGGTGYGNGGLAIINSTSGTGRIYFGDAVGSDTARNRGQINYQHSSDSMVIATAGTTRITINSSGLVTIAGGATLDTGEFGMTTASGTPQSRFMDFGFLNNSLNMRRTDGGETNHTNFLTVASSLIVSGDLNDTSDEKLKKNIASIADGAIAIIKQLRPVTFDWIDEKRNNNVSGFIAQEIKTVLPNLVYGTEYDPTLVDETKGSKGGIKSEGYSVNTVGITAHLTKALQEAIVKIETLETKVAALEAA